MLPCTTGFVLCCRSWAARDSGIRRRAGAGAGRYSLTEEKAEAVLEAEKKLKKMARKVYWDEDILRIQNESRRYLAEQGKKMTENGEE